MTEEIKEIELYNDGKGTTITLFDLHSELEGRTTRKIEAKYLGDTLSESKMWSHDGKLGSLTVLKLALGLYLVKVSAMEDIKTKEDVADWYETYFVNSQISEYTAEQKNLIIKQISDKLGIK